jgi:hypothetical protein
MATSLRKSALELEPYFQEPYLDYASNLLVTGHKDKAIQILEQGIKNSYESDRINNLLRAIRSDLQIGTDVQHNLYGYGKVVSITTSTVSVKFNENIGTLTFDRSRAPLAFVR